jgi:tetratricopeptide (TPR) repeat protein
LHKFADREAKLGVANLVFLMLISLPKVSLFYFTVCVVVGTVAFSAMTNGNSANRTFADDQAHPAIADLLPTVQLAVDNLPAPIAKAPPLTPIQEANAIFQKGEQARLADQSSVALTHYAAAMDLAESEGHQQFQATIWQRIAKTYHAARDMKQAEIYYQKAIKLAQATDDRVILGEAQNDLAQLYETQGDRQRALPLYRQALANLRAIGDQQTAQQVLQQTEKLAIALKPIAKPIAKTIAKPIAKTPAKTTITKTPAKTTIAITQSPTINAAIAPESNPQPEWANRPTTDPWQTASDPEPPITGTDSAIVQPVVDAS